MTSRDDVIALKERVSGLARALAEDDPELSTVAFLQELASWIEPIYEPVYEDCPVDCGDRLGSYLYGWPWTSDEYPWPTNGGLPEAPMVQLNLDEIRGVSGKELGTGLLQVFQSQLRVIPRSAIDESVQPQAFPWQGLTPYEIYRQVYGKSSDEHQKLLNMHRNASEFEALGRIDTARWSELEESYEHWLSFDLMRYGFRINSSGFKPARRIVGWNANNECYTKMWKSSNDEILAEMSGLESFEELVVHNENFCNAIVNSWGLFSWPELSVDTRSPGAKPIFPFEGALGEGLGNLIFVDFWHIMHLEQVDVVSGKSSLGFELIGDCYH